MKKYLGYQANYVDPDENEVANAVHDSEEEYDNDPEDSGIMVLDKVNAHR
jgi:hypothetical protein